MTRQILNVARAAYEPWGQGERFRARIAWVSAAMGSRKLGFNVTLVPPGKSAFPYHAHHANEELFFVLEGRGRVRIGHGSHPIRKGDLISLPPGRRHAHQILNTSSRPLRYLAVSTMESPEVAEYPDSGKVGVFTGAPPGRTPRRGDRRHYTRVRDKVGYWHGEDGGPRPRR